MGWLIRKVRPGDMVRLDVGEIAAFVDYHGWSDGAAELTVRAPDRCAFVNAETTVRGPLSLPTDLPHAMSARLYLDRDRVDIRAQRQADGTRLQFRAPQCVEITHIDSTTGAPT